MIRAVIFDLDGVVVTTDELHYLAWKKLAEEIGINNFTREDNVRQRGISRMASLEVVLPGDCVVIGDSDAGIEAAKNAGMYAIAIGAAEKNSKADASARSLQFFNYRENQLFCQ